MIRIARWAVTVLAIAGVGVACGSSSKPSSTGALDVVVLSDMSLPKDIDRISVQVTQAGVTLLAQQSDVGPDALHVPATFEVKGTNDPSPVTIQAVGYKNGDARVERDAVTPIPANYVAELRLALNFVCVGTATTDADGTVHSTCLADETCVNGSCQSSTVSTAPPAAPVSDTPDAGGTSMAAACFDVATCFADALPATLSAASCLVTLPAKADLATLNLGIEFPIGGPGSCDKAACYIPLTGWSSTDGVVELPPSVCEAASAQGGQLVLSTVCNTEPDGSAVCGAWSSSTTPIVEPTPPIIATSCVGPAQRACGLCGTQSRVCTNGEYGPWDACSHEGLCEPGMTQSCGSGGSQTCSDECQWAACGCSADQLSCGKAGDCSAANDARTCGTCTNDCTALPHVVAASVGCKKGQCAYECKAGFADCGSGDGFTTDLSDPASCGACDNDCSALEHVAGPTTCDDGQCEFPASSCARGYGDCDAEPKNGCELPLDTADHCGACATECAGATPFCDSTSGTPHCVSTCANTACGSACVDLSTNPADCGACATICPSPAHGQASCTGGQCGITCSSGYVACSGACVDLTSDAANCGKCGTLCGLPNATASCKSGACTLVTCAAGFDNCDANPANGCETNLKSDAANCGLCKTKCDTAQAVASATCTAGQCAVASCTTGHDDCNGTASDGCEVDLNTDPKNCGKCKAACSLANATATCSSGSCAIGSCASGFDTCDGNAANGCETDLSSDVNHCGACATKCGALANATPGCSASKCGVGSCASGFDDCNKTAADGCEVNLNMDPKNCGKCNAACSLTNATATCKSGSCAVSACSSGFDNCDANASNGCEANLSSDANNCGACGTKCGAGTSCQSGLCRCSGNCATTKIATAFQPVGLALDAKNIYWTDINPNGTYTYPAIVTQTPQYSGVVMQAPIGGGTPIMISWNQVAPKGIAVDATSIYWTNSASGQIMKAPIGGGVVPTQLYVDSEPPYAIAVNGSNVFWNDETGLVKTVPLAGATSAIQVNNGTFPWGGSTPGGLTVDGANVYYAEDNEIWQLGASSNQGKGLALASGLTNPFAVTVDAKNVYWSTFNGTAPGVMQTPISGSSSITIATTPSEVIDIAVDSTTAYWMTVSPPNVMKAPIGGGGTPITLTTLPTGQLFSFFNTPLGLALSSTSVFYLTNSSAQNPAAGTGAIMRVSK